MFGNVSYRYPKLFIFFEAIKTLWLPYVLQGIIVMHWKLSMLNCPPIMILAVPCVTIFLAVDNVIVYYGLYDTACKDAQAQWALEQNKWANKEDYLLWATMESYKLYHSKHKEDKHNATKVCYYGSFILVFLLFIFALCL